VTTVGIDIGGTNIRVVLHGDDGVPGADAKLRTPMTGDRGATVEVLLAGVQEVTADADVDVGSLAGVGVGAPGAGVEGTVGPAVHVPGWNQPFEAITPRWC
jgi:glucokinase